MISWFDRCGFARAMDLEIDAVSDRISSNLYPTQYSTEQDRQGPGGTTMAALTRTIDGLRLVAKEIP